jgi:hypothetical protein
MTSGIAWVDADEYQHCSWQATGKSGHGGGDIQFAANHSLA